MSVSECLLYAALFFGITGYTIYWHGLRRELVRPNRFSWLIWSAVTTVEALTYQAVNQGLVQNLIFFMSAASCLFITIAIWRDSSDATPSRTESFSMIVAILALIIWIGFHETLWAHLLMVASVPVSFLPTWISAGEDRQRELSPAWGLWSLGDLATLLMILSTGVHDPKQLFYIVVELLCHAAIWWRIGLGSINFLAIVQDEPFHIRADTLCGNPETAFRVETNGKGLAVLAAKAFAPGAELMEFTGTRYHRSEVLVHRPGREDRFLQVGPESYLGPSGQLDDLVNHSCSPNAGLKFIEDGRVLLVAIRTIAPGDELSWDYSTTSSSSHFSMRCGCGSDQCRDVIGDFEFLSPELQNYYRRLELVPPYLRLDPPKPGVQPPLAA